MSYEMQPIIIYSITFFQSPLSLSPTRFHRESIEFLDTPTNDVSTAEPLQSPSD